MTRKRLTAVLASILLSGLINAQTTNAFRVNYNQALFDLPGSAIEALTPNNYVFAGTNLTFIPIYGTVTQVNETGNLVWSKRYSDASIGFQLWDIKRDPVLNEYYVCGGSESNAAVFMRLDATGNVIQQKKFNISQASSAFFNRVIKTSDGGYVAVGYVTGHDPDGAGPEIPFNPITYTDTDGNSQTDYISSPLIVKMDANGNHIWHKVFRYYTNAAKDPATHRIYNDASFNDVVETADGYIAVGQYDVNQHRSATNSDGDDSTPRDALILKTDFSGGIVYHRQYDTPNTSTTQTSKYLSAINKTSTGDAIAVGNDGSTEWFIKFNGTGGWSSIYSRRFTFPGFGAVAEASQIYEVNGGTDLVTMGTYISPLTLTFANYLHRVNPGATANVWTRQYNFSLLAILPRGSQVSDNGHLLLSMTLGGTNYDYHLIKTDPNGDTPLSGCAPTNMTPTANTGSTTVADPFYNFWSGTVGPQNLAVAVLTINPTSSVQCSFVACTPPTITTQPSNVTICSTGTANVSVAASAGPYQWQYNNGGTWANVANGTPAGFSYTNSTTNNMTINTSGVAQGTYQFRVLVGDAACQVISDVITVTVPGATRLAPLGAQCSGTQLNFEAFPASGATYAWTVTPPGGTSATPTSGSGQTFSFVPTNTSGSSVTFPVSVQITHNSVTCTVNFNPTILPTPTAPVVGTITQPTCATPTGSVALSGLPSGSWTVTASPGGATQSGSGTTATFTGLNPSTNYTFTVTNSDGCTSTASTSAAINAAPVAPSAPITGTVTQPTCIAPTGSVQLSGLPAGSWTITASPGGATQTGSTTSTTFTGLNPGNYTFTVTNSDGCTSTASASVGVNTVPGAPTAPTAGTVTQPTCAIPTGTIVVDSPLGAQYTYSIDGTTFQAGTTFSGLTPGSYTITVLDNTSGCSSVSAAAVTIDPVANAPVVTLVSSTSVTCSGETDGELEISISGGQAPYTIVWDPNVGSTTTLENLAAGAYSVSVTDDNGCSTAATFNVGSPAALIVNGTSTNVLCGIADGTITTAVTGGTAPYTYAWTPNGESTTTLSGLAAGAYSVQVTDDNGCTANQSFTLTTIGNLPVNIDPSYVEIEAGESVVLTATGGDNYVWTPTTGLSCTNCANPTANPTVTTTYYVSASDDNGCTGGDSSLVVIKLACGDLFVPTIFSPNGTGPDANNKLCVFGTASCIEDLKFQIYNRWGELVFETTDIETCWDGNYKDKPANSGIFVYRLYVKLFNNDEPIDISGNTTLVR